jgi:malate dehydrogenase (oxaloacetate-decarboxylating)(NADP+)
LPRIGLLSFSNFGSVAHPQAAMVRKARELVRQQAPELQVEGEMQVDLAMMPQLQQHDYPFCTLDGPANVLIFPDMQSGNIAYKLLQRLAGAKIVGPVLLGLNAPAYVMQRHARVGDIFNLITVAAAQCSLVPRESLARVVEKVRITRTGLEQSSSVPVQPTEQLAWRPPAR